MKNLVVIGLIGLLLSIQVDCTSPNFRKHPTKSQLQQRAQHNAYCAHRKIVEQDKAAQANKNDTSFLKTIKNYTQDQQDATVEGAIILSVGLVGGYLGHQVFTQGALSDNVAHMLGGVCITGVFGFAFLRGQNIIVNAYHYKDLHNIMRSKIK